MRCAHCCQGFDDLTKRARKGRANLTQGTTPPISISPMDSFEPVEKERGADEMLHGRVVQMQCKTPLLLLSDQHLFLKAGKLAFAIRQLSDIRCDSQYVENLAVGTARKDLLPTP